MFPINCKKTHEPNYKESCCLNHLIMMNDHSDVQMTNSKYSRLLFKTLNHHFKLNDINYKHIKFDMLKSFLEILSKYIGFFFLSDKSEYAKILVKIAINACTLNDYSEHHEISIRKMAIINNLGCLYEKYFIFILFREKKWDQAIKYFKIGLKYSVNNFDKAMFYNNVSKVFYKSGLLEDSFNSMNQCYQYIKEESEKLKIEKLQNKSTNENFVIKSKLLSFLYFNYGILLSKFNHKTESFIIFNKGLKFSTSKLGENNFLTIKYKPKIQEFIQNEKSAINFTTLNKSFSSDECNNNLNSNDFSTNFITREMTFKNKELEEENQINEKLQNIHIYDSEEKEKNEFKIDKPIKDPSIFNNRNINSGSPLESRNVPQTTNLLNISNVNKENKIKSLGDANHDKSRPFLSHLLKDKKIKFDEEKVDITKMFQEDNYKITINKKNSPKSDTFDSEVEEVTENKKSSFTIQNDMEAENIHDTELKSLIEKETLNKKNSNRKSKKIKEMFSEALHFKKKNDKNSPGVIEKLLSGGNIFNKNNYENNDKYFNKNSSNKNITPIANSYDNMMSKFDNEQSSFEEISNGNHNNPNNEKSITAKSSLFGEKIEISNVIKPQLLNEMKNYLFKIAIDDSNDDYIFETLAFRNKIYTENSVIKDSKMTKNESNKDFLTFRNKDKRVELIEHFKMTSCNVSKNDIIESEFNYDILETENNYYNCRVKDDLNMTEFFEKLITTHIDSTKTFCTFKKIDDQIFKIVTSYTTFENEKGFIIKLYEQKNLICENFIFLSKITNFLHKMSIYNILPIHIDLHMISSIEMLIEKIFIHLCFPIFSEASKSVSVAILRKPVGVFAHKLIEFKFLDTKCSIDFMILEERCINAVIFSDTDSKYIQLIFDVDDDSFNLLFKEITDNSEITQNEVLIPSYYFVNYGYMGKNGIIPKIFIRIHEILKTKMQEKSTEVCNFKNFLLVYPNALLKVQIRNELKNIDLWMINYENINKWLVDYYSLEKVEISNKLIYIHKSLLLDEQDYINITGMDPTDNLNLLNQREMNITNYLLLDSVKMRNINTKILTEMNYDFFIKLIKIKPNVFLKYCYTLKHNKHYYIVSFEFLIYSPISFYAKLLITETQTCRTYSKIFLPLKNRLISNDDELKNEIESEFKLSKKMFEDMKHKDKFKNILNEWVCLILKKNVKYNQYESLIKLMEKLN